ncbi:CheW protein [Raphidiopsis curvata NIES-932]|nr:CheW protein [Raphidiopsis curvata NIES-932]
MVSKPDFVTDPRQNPLAKLPENTDTKGFKQFPSLKDELYLRFYLSSPEEFALPLISIKEVIEVTPNQIIPIPNTSPLVLGVVNWRGRLVWVVDLGKFMGEMIPLNPERRSQVSVITTEYEDTIIGLAVDQICATFWLDMESVVAPTDVPDGIVPFVEGEWLDSENNKSVKLINQKVILQSDKWASMVKFNPEGK